MLLKRASSQFYPIKSVNYLACFDISTRVLIQYSSRNPRFHSRFILFFLRFPANPILECFYPAVDSFAAPARLILLGLCIKYTGTSYFFIQCLIMLYPDLNSLSYVSLWFIQTIFLNPIMFYPPFRNE